MSAVRYSNEFR